jgi:hypothetical protein
VADLTPLDDDGPELRLAPGPNSDPLGIGNLPPIAAPSAYGAGPNSYLQRPQMAAPRPKNLFWERWKERQKVKGIMLLILMVIFGIPLMCLCSLGVLVNMVSPPDDRPAGIAPPSASDLKAPPRSRRAGP